MCDFLILKNFTFFCLRLQPFANRNDGPRNVFECAMAKQALGINGTSINQRFDGTSVSLYYPQQPLAQTKSLKLYLIK